MRILFRLATRLLLILVCTTLDLSLLEAAVSPVAWYRLGDKDPGAAAGAVGNATTLDFIAARNLNRVGSPTYLNNAVASATNALGSTLGMRFGGNGNLYSRAVLSTAQNNFGVEAWVFPSGGFSTQFIVHNGNPALNGWGLVMDVGGTRVDPIYNFSGLLGGGTRVGTFSTGRTLRGMHLALVRDNGVSTFYLDGVARGSSAVAPLAPTSAFALAANGVTPTNSPFTGFIDEVRVFTFVAGQFSPSDLLVNQRRVTTEAVDNFTTDSARLNGKSSGFALATAGWFEFGTNANLGTVTSRQTINPAATPTNFSQVVTGLSPNLTYFFRALTSNSLGVTTGALASFNIRPAVDTLVPTNLTATAAKLQGVANPKGVAASVFFEWGTTTNYGFVTSPLPLAAGSGQTNFSETISNLFAGGTFHYRAVLSSAEAVLTGTNVAFTTPPDASGALFIPGGVAVTISPPEAVADGARWSLDDGGLEMFSGLAQGPVAPGRHTVRFRNLPNWRETVPLEVFVVGGRTSAVSVVFTPIPTFAVGTVPEQHARLGELLEFTVNGVPPGAQLQVIGTPPPSLGSFSFDPQTGRVVYAAGATDRLPFELTYLINGVSAGTSTITPLQALPPEAGAISYDRPLPDDESRDYITISEQLSAGEELFNNFSNRVFTVDISGKTLVFEAGHPAFLHPVYNGRENIRELRLHADLVIIRSPLELPQTRVTIRARELRFEGAGAINTTPRSAWLKPREVTWADDNTIGFPGSPGHDAGDVEVFVERFHADPGAVPRFVMRGGNGGPPGEGRNGVFEGGLDPVFFPGFPINPTNVSYVGNSNWMRLMARAGNPTNCGISNTRLKFFSESLLNGVVNPSLTCGNETTVARGEPAVPSGVPGAGGRGGTLRSTLDLSSYVSQPGGGAGTNGGNYVGGTLVFQYVYEHISQITVGPNQGITVSYTQAPKVPGANATAPGNTNGVPGSFVVIPDPSSWLHSFSLRALVRFAKDAYLNGRTAEARALMAEYSDVLNALQPVVNNVTNLSDAEFSETAGLDQLAQEMGAIVNRIDMNLDFFGNPVGWVPMLSFEANLTAFQNEINQSIPILYLAYWLNYSATNLQNSALASEEALRLLRSELTRLVTAYNEVQSTMPGLKSEAARIQESIVAIRNSLVFLERDLTARAQQNLEEKNKLPFWKKAIGVLAVAADLVPVGQPTIGKIGEGLKRLNQFDPDHPVESISNFTNAFQKITNKNVSICFSGSVTNTTNNAGTAKAARRAKLKTLGNCGKFLQAEFKELAAVFKETKVDAKELQAEIEKLKASDPVFQAMTKQLTELNKEKERFATDLSVALQAIATLASDMTENLITTDEMEERVANQFAALDHNALLHIKEMERRAKDRLLKFQYFAAQAFQYRLLRPFNGNFNLNALLDRFQAIVAGTNAHVLTQQEFDNLKSLFIADLANTTDLALTTLNANAPERALPRFCTLTAEELQLLNATNALTLNLAQRVGFPSSQEDIRIVNLRVTDIRVRPVGGPIGLDAAVFLDFNHLGESQVSRGGSNFVFRHYQTRTVSPISWNAVLDVPNRATNNSVLSVAAQSLLRLLLGNRPDEDMLLFSRPAADAEILIRREVITDNGIDLAIEHLVFEVEYEFAQQSLNQRTLDVEVTDDLQPVIVVSVPDASGRRDGQGDFRRVYPPNTTLTLQAPAIYGGHPFDRWVINNVLRPAGSNSVTFPLTTGTKAEARYGNNPTAIPAPILTLLPPTPDAVGFRFSTVLGQNYVIERKLTLDDPAWTLVDALPGTGGLLQFTRPTTNGSSFFRLRVE